MNPSLFIPILFFIIYCSPISAESPKFTTCNKAIQCGSIPNITYPFYDGKTRPDYCGYPGFKLDCDSATPQITISNQEYNLLEINKPANTITISSNNFNFTNGCPNSLTNSTIDFSKFSFSSADQNLTFFYDCSLPNSSLQTECDLLGSRSTGYYLTRSMLEANNTLDMLGDCKSSILFPILRSEAELITNSPSLAAVVNAFKAGFELGLIPGITGSCGSCVGSGGACGYDSGKFVCNCVDDLMGHSDLSCGGVDPVKDKGNRMVKFLLISVLSGSAAILLLVLSVYYCRRKIQGTNNSRVTRDNRNVENALKSHESLAPKRYTYSNIKKMTNSFSEELGEGGFGKVYKGKLIDGRLVAVKFLKSSKGNEEGFINEVASMGRTSHVNVITLLGFCLEGNKRALVYEYMVNGSLEKFMHSEANINGNSSLSLDALFGIVLGIARGLEYLHRGCITRILHFDIKPHNILLDEEFFPKISDFGLAKVTPQDKQSRVSMSGMRGTVGYIAPEVFCRSFGDVSHKSDVYSYGMMILEVIGSRKRANRDRVENSSELYFPQWLYKELEQSEEVEVDINMNDSDEDLKRKMIVVSLWCIQPVPSSRPSMSQVVQMLEGSLESIDIPTMPLLSSPPRPQWDSSISAEYINRHPNLSTSSVLLPRSTDSSSSANPSPSFN